MHSTEYVNERKLESFVLTWFERHFQLPVGNSDYPKSTYPEVLVMTAMAHRLVNGFAETMKKTRFQCREDYHAELKRTKHQFGTVNGAALFRGTSV